MCWGRKRSLMAWRAVIFSCSSVTNSARPKAMAERYWRVNEPSLGPMVGVHRVTAERQTSGCTAMASSLSPSGAQWKYQSLSLVEARDKGTPYEVPSGRVKLTVMYGALCMISKAHSEGISLLVFLIGCWGIFYSLATSVSISSALSTMWAGPTSSNSVRGRKPHVTPQASTPALRAVCISTPESPT